VATRPDEFPPELTDIATSIAASVPGGDPPAGETVLALLTAALDARLADRPKAIVAGWRERDALAGQQVRWDGGEGVAEGINDDGALAVRTEAGRVFLDAGEVHLRRSVPPSGEFSDEG
jgi:BirA family biotin operon repressor/biotin-[acetyl-CoA-carboxylase] ligase